MLLDNNIRVIIHTGHGSYGAVKEALNFGAFAYVEKAGDPALLLLHVHRAFLEHNRITIDELRLSVRESENRFAKVFNHASDSISITSFDAGRFLDVNRSFERMTGYQRDEVIGKTVSELALWENQNDRKQLLAMLEDNNAVSNHIARMRHKDGTIFEAEITVNIIQIADVDYLVAVGRDITRRKLTEDELRLAATAFQSPEGIIITDVHATILRVNNAFTTITGYSTEEVIGQNPRILQSGKHDSAFYQDMWDSLKQNGVWKGEVYNRKKNGDIFIQWESIAAVKDETGKVTHYIAHFHDITQRKQDEACIQHLAYHDALTDLPNRALFTDRLNQLIAQNKRPMHKGATLFLDLDHFKMINDSLGHAVGDELLRQVTQRMLEITRAEDTVARLGGDEFVILLGDLGTDREQVAQEAQRVASKLKEFVSQPYRINENELHINTSIGIVIFPDDADNADDILKNADIAMYRAKESGRNNIKFYLPKMTVYANERLRLEGYLHHAIEKQEFMLYYQPLVDINHDNIIGAEALLRWIHPKQGILTPDSFIPILEETGMIYEVGDWIIQNVCRFLQTNFANGNASTTDFRIAVNISPRQFRQTDFARKIINITEAVGISAECLELELTENILISDIETIANTMSALKQQGISFSIDDFGTGYSSLAYLKDLPIDTLKIDRMFIQDMTTNKDDSTLVETIIGMAKNLGLMTVAEGVETKKQLSFLKNRGCQQYQGYLYSRPLPEDEFVALFMSNISK